MATHGRFKRSLHIAVGCIFLALILVASSAFVSNHKAEKEVRAAIDLYFKGAETADAEYFNKAFALGVADMTFVRADRETGEEMIRRVPIEDAITGWTREPAGETWGKIGNVQILDDRLAHVTLDILWHGTIYTDVMSLYKVNGDWKIVNKTFVVKERKADK